MYNMKIKVPQGKYLAHKDMYKGDEYEPVNKDGLFVPLDKSKADSNLKKVKECIHYDRF